MNKSFLLLLRTLLILAILFSGLEKAYSYLILKHDYAIETNPFPQLIIQTTGLFTGHMIGFILSIIYMCFMYKLSVEIDSRRIRLVGVLCLAIALSMFFAAFLENLRSLQIPETS